MISLTFLSASAHKLDPSITRPTIVLVHGAFADQSSWRETERYLAAAGHPVVIATSDFHRFAETVDDLLGLLETLPGPLVLVGHSYGALVIDRVASAAANVKALVYVSAFASNPTTIEAKAAPVLSGSCPVFGQKPKADARGLDKYLAYFLISDFSAAPSYPTMARDITIGRPSPKRPSPENSIPQILANSVSTWMIYGDEDEIIPPEALGYMASLYQPKSVETVRGGKHALMVSHPWNVARFIGKAARAVQSEVIRARS